MRILQSSLAHMNFLGELKHPCRHDAQNDSDVRKITYTFSLKKLISQKPLFFFSLLSLIERYVSPLFNEVIFRYLKKNYHGNFAKTVPKFVFFSV